VLDRDDPGDRVPLDSTVKCDRSGTVPVILVPQPSDDPNDPLVRSVLPLRVSPPNMSRIGRYGGGISSWPSSLSWRSCVQP
jgi:hypothetical protein